MNFQQVDVSVRQRVKMQYGDVAERHLHFEDGFTLAAIHKDEIAGFASFVWRDLVEPLDDLNECFVDIIETHPEFRRKGIASRLLAMAEELARCSGAYQLRAWSSCDKVAALRMWSELGYGLAPAVVYPSGKEVHGYYVTKTLHYVSALPKDRVDAE